jgi:hypothetical protein
MSPDDHTDKNGGSGPTGPTGPTLGSGATGTGAGDPGVGGTSTGAPGSSGATSAAGGAATVVNHKPHIESIAVFLATGQGTADPERANVVSLAAVAVPDEAWLDVKGQHFTTESVVRINGRPVATELTPANDLIASLTPSALRKPGEYRVTVFTPGAGGGVSNVKNLFAEPEPAWGWLEKGLVGGALLAAALWIFWILTSIRDRTEPANWLLTWAAMIVILAAFILGVGRALTGTWKSLLIDERNKQSLSRLQVVLWTLLVVSGIATAAAWNIHQDVSDPLGLHVPEQLWILLGISTTALIGSNLIKMQQGGPDLTEKEAQDELARHVSEATQGRETATGSRVDNVSLVQARWTDMFQGEGVDNYHTLDVGKIQMFFFTVVLVLAYAAAFAREAFVVEAYTAPGRFDFPAFEGSLVALLGVSSVAYLLNKAGKAR